MKVTMKVAELSGSALDYAVDRAIHGERYSERLSLIRTAGDSFRPSSSWSKCGMLITQYQIALIPESHDGWVGTELSERWYANIYFEGGNEFTTGMCETPLIAACRAIVGMKFGDEIEIPKELLKQGGAS